jgi:hypothetical protein
MISIRRQYSQIPVAQLGAGSLIGQFRLEPSAGGEHGGVAPPPLAERLPLLGLEGRDRSAAVWWVGPHGGAGETTLEELFVGSRAAGHRWPIGADQAESPRVVLVARTHARGLMAAQSAMREWAAGGPQVVLLGLVLIADAPGRAPAVLRERSAVIGGGVPRVGSLPWIEAWRLGEPPTPANSPPQVRRLLEDLKAMTAVGRSA